MRPLRAKADGGVKPAGGGNGEAQAQLSSLWPPARARDPRGPYRSGKWFLSFPIVWPVENFCRRRGENFASVESEIREVCEVKFLKNQH